MTEKSKPAVAWLAVIPSDATEYSPALRSLWVGTGGAVAVEGADGVSATFAGVQGILPVEAVKVLATGTTASNIVGLRQ